MNALIRGYNGRMTSPALAIRDAVESDAPAIARLLTALGHSTTTDIVAAKWTAWRQEGNSALVALNEDGAVAAVAVLHRMSVLHRPYPVGRINALIVDESLRGSGIGRSLVEAAERRLAQEGCELMEITSNVRRVDAHAFYDRLGYERSSIRFSKAIAS
jgi:predicted N-acetyltransferase YhbS